MAPMLVTGEMSMEATDFSGLVARAVAGLEEVRGCLLVSRDGLTLGAYPQGGEERARHAWDRLESVGEPERGFLVVADEVWVFARRGPYACIVVATAGAKAGLLLDRMESTLRAAEEARLQSGSAPATRPDATRRPRTPLHREPRSEPRPAEPVFEEIVQLAASDPVAAEAPGPPAPEPPPPAVAAPAEQAAPPAENPAPVQASIAPPVTPPAAPLVVPDVQPSSPSIEPTPPGGGDPAGGAAPSSAPPPVQLPPEPPPADPVPAVETAPAPEPAPAEPVAAAEAEPLLETAPEREPEPEPTPAAPAADFEPPRLAMPHTPEPPVPAYEPPTSLLGEVGLIPEAPSPDPRAEPASGSLPELAQEPEPPLELAPEPPLTPAPEAPVEEPPSLDLPIEGDMSETASAPLGFLPDLPEAGDPAAQVAPDSPKEDAEVDAVALAREFAQLFDEPDSRDGG